VNLLPELGIGVDFRPLESIAETPLVPTGFLEIAGDDFITSWVAGNIPAD
jgi:hypothetical protein